MDNNNNNNKMLNTKRMNGLVLDRTATVEGEGAVAALPCWTTTAAAAAAAARAAADATAATPYSLSCFIPAAASHGRNGIYCSNTITAPAAAAGAAAAACYNLLGSQYAALPITPTTLPRVNHHMGGLIMQAQALQQQQQYHQVQAQAATAAIAGLYHQQQQQQHAAALLLLQNVQQMNHHHHAAPGIVTASSSAFRMVIPHPYPLSQHEHRHHLLPPTPREEEEARCRKKKRMQPTRDRDSRDEEDSKKKTNIDVSPSTSKRIKRSLLRVKTIKKLSSTVATAAAVSRLQVPRDDSDDEIHPGDDDEADNNNKKQEPSQATPATNKKKQQQHQPQRQAWDNFYQLLLLYQLEHDGDLDVPQKYETKNGFKVRKAIAVNYVVGAGASRLLFATLAFLVSLKFALVFFLCSLVGGCNDKGNNCHASLCRKGTRN
jgi:hypothetical protein